MNEPFEGGAGLGPAGAQQPVELRATQKEGARGGTMGSPTRVLVTGGAGFIPSNLIRHLLEHTGHDVISLDALTYAGNLENLAEVMSHPRLEFVHGDIRDSGLVGEVVAEVDVIVNAAAESHVEKSIREGASEFVTTNVEGTQILLDKANVEKDEGVVPWEELVKVGPVRHWDREPKVRDLA